MNRDKATNGIEDVGVRGCSLYKRNLINTEIFTSGQSKLLSLSKETGLWLSYLVGICVLKRRGKAASISPQSRYESSRIFSFYYSSYFNTVKFNITPVLYTAKEKMVHVRLRFGI